MRRTLTILTATATLATVAFAAGCGGSDDSGDAATTPAPPATSPATTPPATTVPAAAATVDVTLGKPEEFSLVAAPTAASAGKVTFVVKNSGAILHEMVVVPGTPASLRLPDGTASEDGAAGEVPDVTPGAGGELTVTLPAGTYTLLCNLPGHYAGGMFAPFTVG